jgi:hypothetical protein
MSAVAGELYAIFRWPGYVVADSGCWEWQRVDSVGYGSHITWRGRAERPHVIWWRMAGRVIPAGLTLDHLCRNRRCVNPDHLEPVTRAENARRGERAKVGHEGARRARERAAAGERIKDIAADLGVAPGTVSSIVVGRSWA